MNNKHFCFWLQGYCELTGNKQPTFARWKLIVEHLDLASEVDKSGYYNFDNFAETLQGFIAINGIHKVSADQWEMITTKLQNCFSKVTSTVEGIQEDKPFMSPEDISEILKDVVRKEKGEPIPPYLPPQHPLQGPRPGEIICDNNRAFCSCEGQSTNPDDFQASLEKAYDSQNVEASLIDR